MPLSSTNTSRFLIEADEVSLETGGPLVLDTRTPEDYLAGHIPGSINLCTYECFVRSTSSIGLNRFAKEQAERYKDAGVSRSHPIVVYDGNIGMRAARECWMLNYIGHSNAKILIGGMNGWISGQMPVSTESTQLPTADFQADPQADMVIGISGIVAQSGIEKVTILDVRSHAEFSGTDGSKCCGRQGRLPGAIRIEWSQFLDEHTGAFKHPEVIREIVKAAGISTAHEIIPYCHRGARSSVAYYALKHAGYSRVKNFIGSWHEWAARNDIPVESGS